MKILSWDVGIKNLAFCLLHKIDDQFEIIKWGVINLVEDRQKCDFIIRGGNSCGELAKTCIYHTDKINLFNDAECKYACTKHKDKLIPKLEKGKDNKCMHCSNDCTSMLLNTSYGWCDEHIKKSESFVKKIRAKKVTVVNCTKQPMQELAEKLFSKLDTNHPEFMKVDNVIIENQPSLRNPTMKTLSAILYSYFVIRGITDKERMQSTIQEIRFVSPSNKLKIDRKTTEIVLGNNDDKSKAYKMTKKLGIKYCSAIISQEDLELLNTYKKKDDLCDSFLQGFQYLFNPVPKIHFDKLAKIGFEEEKPKVKKTKDLTSSNEK